MFSLLLVTVVLNGLAFGAENKKHVDTDNTLASNGGTSLATRNNVASHHNITYIDKAENVLRTPNIKKYFEEHKKKKKPKKTPKRTVQKIIKKNKGKLRRVYFTRKAKPSTSPPKIDYEKMYGAEDNKKWKRDSTTTPSNQKKKTKRKYSPKHSGYHMPFQKIQKKDKKDKRHKRGLSRELYILKDLDEIEFLSNEGDKDVVKAHVKNFW